MSDRIPTLADLCCALVEGNIPATIDGSTYAVNALELRHYLNKFRSLPTISSNDSQIIALHKESGNWSTSAQSQLA